MGLVVKLALCLAWFYEGFFILLASVTAATLLLKVSITAPSAPYGWEWVLLHIYSHQHQTNYLMDSFGPFLVFGDNPPGIAIKF